MAEVATSCKATKAQLTVKVANGEDVPVDVTLESALGSRTLKDLDPGQGKSHTFSVKGAELPAGEVVITATAVVDGEEVASTQTVAYAARSCG